MCRIVGGWEFGAGGGHLFDSIENMRDSMVLGGPNGAGVYFAKDARVALAHRRLSVVDLSARSAQPFISKDGRFVLTFNGEIYNYKEIARNLRKEGVDCEGYSDTEVVMASFIHAGVDCVANFEGMFAFAIWDNLEQKIYCFRDRIGVKPLYYYLDSSCFLFSSELKGLLAYPKLKKQINKESLSYFFSLGYIPSCLSILESCYKLEAGTYLIIDSKRNLHKHRYYTLEDSFLKKNNYNKDTLIALCKSSIRQRTVSDVPVCACLSGGVDSSLVCALLNTLGYGFESFTIGFKEIQFDESHFAKRVAECLGIKNHCFICDLNEAKELIAEIPFVYDEPFGDSSAIPTLLLAKKIAQTHRVALSADGGDELMLGYDRYAWASSRWEEYRLKRQNKLLNALLSCCSAEVVSSVAQKFGINLSVDKFLRIKNQYSSKTFLEHYLVEISHFRKEDLRANKLPLLSTKANGMSDIFALMSCFDFKNYLPEDILTKTDRASMHYGLEMREPLLGRELVDYVCGLDSSIKRDKTPFKEILESFLPKELIYRPKMGFGVPLQNWMQGELRGLIDEVLRESEPYLDAHYVRRLLEAFDSKKRVDFAKVWYIYVFCAWRKWWKI